MTPAWDIVGIGHATVDVLAVVPHPPGPDEVMRTQRTAVAGGGPVATALVAAARLGASTAYLGVVGADDWGQFILADFRRHGVDTACVRVAPGGSSALSVIVVDAPTGSRAIMYDPGSRLEMSLGPSEEAAIRSARVLHLDGAHSAAALAAARVRARRGTLVSFDGGAGEPRHDLDPLLASVDVLVVARKFARNVTGSNDPQTAGPALRRLGAREVVITDGAEGCWYWDSIAAAKETLYQPAFQVEVVDTTGAGDVFHGAYLYALLQGWPPAHRLSFAAATAALKCTNIGGRSGIPTLAQVLAFLEEAK